MVFPFITGAIILMNNTSTVVNRTLNLFPTSASGLVHRGRVSSRFHNSLSLIPNSSIIAGTIFSVYNFLGLATYSIIRFLYLLF